MAVLLVAVLLVAVLLVAGRRVALLVAVGAGGATHNVGASVLAVAVNPAPSSLPPAVVSAVISCAPGPESPVPDGTTSFHVVPSAEVRTTTSDWPGAPAVPTATKPLPVAVKPVSLVKSAGTGTVISRQVSPPFGETATSGTLPVGRTAVPAATTVLPDAVT